MRALLKPDAVKYRTEGRYREWYIRYENEPFDCEIICNHGINLYLVCGEALELQKSIFDFENPNNEKEYVWLGPMAFTEGEVAILSPLHIIKKRLTGKYI